MKIDWDSRLTKDQINDLESMLWKSFDNNDTFNTEDISDFEKLDDINISVIEKYLRMKKLENLKKK